MKQKKNEWKEKFFMSRERNRKLRKLLLVLCFLFLQLSVIPAVKTEAAVKLSATKVTMGVKEKLTLKVTGTKKTVKWKSSKPAVASVSSKGVVTAKKTGKTSISAKVGTKKLTCMVTVTKTGYKALYKVFLEQEERRNASSKYPHNLTFSLVDIDQNGLPELIVKSASRDDPFISFSVYTVTNKKVTEAGTFYEKYSNDKSGYISQFKALYNKRYDNGGREMYTLYKLSNGKLKESIFLSIYVDWTTASLSTHYRAGTSMMDQKEVSKAVYTVKLKKYYSNAKKKDFSLTGNTAENRKKILG